jgi:hypothetical protein
VASISFWVRTIIPMEILIIPRLIFVITTLIISLFKNQNNSKFQKLAKEILDAKYTPSGVIYPGNLRLLKWSLK